MDICWIENLALGFHYNEAQRFEVRGKLSEIQKDLNDYMFYLSIAIQSLQSCLTFMVMNHFQEMKIELSANVDLAFPRKCFP